MAQDRSPPNKLRCSKCGREWHAYAWEACSCGSNKVRIFCDGKKKGGGRCEKNPSRGRNGGRCDRHNGRSLSGPAHHAFKHGRRVRVKDRYTAVFEAALRDPGRLSLERQIALSDARLEELRARFSTGESGAAWELLRKLAAEIDAAFRSRPPDRKKIEAALSAFRKVIDGAVDENRGWNEWLKMSDHRQRLTATEVARINAQKRYVPVELMQSQGLALVFAARSFITEIHGQIESVLRKISDGELHPRDVDIPLESLLQGYAVRVRKVNDVQRENPEAGVLANE